MILLKTKPEHKYRIHYLRDKLGKIQVLAIKELDIC